VRTRTSSDARAAPPVARGAPYTHGTEIGKVLARLTKKPMAMARPLWCK